MRVIYHDLTEEQWKKLALPVGPDDYIVSDNGTIHPCISCFNCWLKTPGRCTLKDGYERSGENIAKASEWVFISKCTFGGYSSFVKNALDRSISYVSPHFTERDNEMHHELRYDRHIDINAIFYGEDITEEEKETCRKVVYANARNFNGVPRRIAFVSDPMEVTL